MSNIMNGQTRLFRNYTYCRGQLGLNRKYVYFSDIPLFGDGIDPAAFLLVLRDKIKDKLKACMSSAASYVALSLQMAGEAEDRLTFDPIAGTAGDTPMPLQVSGLIGLYATGIGRTNRGRMYVPFPDFADHDILNNRPVTGYVTRLDSLGLEFIGVQSATVGGVTFKYQFGGVNATNNYRTRVGRPKWATQRRRGNFGQLNDFPG